MFQRKDQRLAGILAFITGIFTISIAQQCPDSSKRTLVKVPQLFRYNISNPCVDGSDHSTYVTSLLDNCTFSQIPNAASFGLCQSACVTDVTCVALTITASSGCEHCLKTGAGGNGNSYPQNKLMVVIEELWSLIDGKH